MFTLPVHPYYFYFDLYLCFLIFSLLNFYSKRKIHVETYNMSIVAKSLVGVQMERFQGVVCGISTF